MTHQVYLAGSGKQFSVGDGETVLAAGLRQHLALPFGCQSGGCGSCRVRCVAGEVAYPFAPPALSPEEIGAGYILMCLAQARSDLTLDLHQPAELEQLRPRTLPCRVVEKIPLAHDVVGLLLKLPRPEGTAAPFRHLAGQYIDFLLDEGRRRSFSIANRPGSEQIELHLRVTPGGRFAHWVTGDMPERAILHFEGPLGAFYVRTDSQRPILLMAGGTGFAPAKAIVEDLFAKGSTRPLHLFWGVRSRRDLYMHERVLEWVRTQPGFSYTPVLSEPDAGWTGATGFVHEALLRAYPRLADFEVYISGPPVMVQAGKRAFAGAGLDADHLFYDSFDYAFETWPAAEVGRRQDTSGA